MATLRCQLSCLTGRTGWQSASGAPVRRAEHCSCHPRRQLERSRRVGTRCPQADVLCDRIAILAEGRLAALGSSLDLKTQYGAGYTLTVVRDSPEARPARSPPPSSSLEHPWDR